VKAPHHSCHTSSPIGHQNTHENSQALENTPYYQEKKKWKREAEEETRVNGIGEEFDLPVLALEMEEGGCVSLLSCCYDKIPETG
jgi:hypothetical protein